MEFVCSNKKSVQAIVNSCHVNGVKHVVLSPGSRNAPLIIAFGNHPELECHTVVDERSAAFYALGMAKRLSKPVAVVCTSGSAVLNYAPAIVEAYYQEVPLVVITADRPPELIDHEDGQTIHQENIYSSYIKSSLNLPVCSKVKNTVDVRDDIDKIIVGAKTLPYGPVHINAPFYEPLYDTESIEVEKVIEVVEDKEAFELTGEQKDIWTNSPQKLIVVGQMNPNKEVEALLHRLSLEQKVVVISSPLSNIDNPGLSTTPDPLFFSRDADKMKVFTPDILITIGGPVVSKFLKVFLRANKPEHHWDIDLNPKRVDTYNCLTQKIESDTLIVLQNLLDVCAMGCKDYYALWQNRKVDTAVYLHTKYADVEWSDLLVFKTFFESLEEKIVLHLANSTPVRYAEFFTKHPDIVYYGNRGVSGIDGSLSTAAGCAKVSHKTVYLITGDLSFLYDSNGLWNKSLPENLKVILINNSGGNIFKVIKGPSDSGQIEHFNGYSPVDISKLCEAYGIAHFEASNVSELEVGFSSVAKHEGSAVLEVTTDPEKSAEAYRNIFKEIV